MPDLTVADNIFLGRETGGLWLAGPRCAGRRRRCSTSLASASTPASPVRSLSVAQQQMVEIARALVTDARVLILDEPSAALTDVEVAACSRSLRACRAGALASSTSRIGSTRSSRWPTR